MDEWSHLDSATFIDIGCLNLPIRNLKWIWKIFVSPQRSVAVEIVFRGPSCDYWTNQLRKETSSLSKVVLLRFAKCFLLTEQEDTSTYTDLPFGIMYLEINASEMLCISYFG